MSGWFSSITSAVSALQQSVVETIEQSREQIAAEEAKVAARAAAQQGGGGADAVVTSPSSALTSGGQRRGRLLSPPPWLVDEEDKSILQAELRTRILSLSHDELAFVSAVPGEERIEDVGVPDYVKKKSAAQSGAAAAAAAAAPELVEAVPTDTTLLTPFAEQALNCDVMLSKLRFELVPKRVSEERFWYRYFYHVQRLRLDIGVDPIDFSPAEPPPAPAAEPDAGDESPEEDIDALLAEEVDIDTIDFNPGDDDFAVDLDAGDDDFGDMEFASEEAHIAGLEDPELVGRMREELGLPDKTPEPEPEPESEPAAALDTSIDDDLDDQMTSLEDLLADVDLPSDDDADGGGSGDPNASTSSLLSDKELEDQINASLEELNL